MEQRTYVIKVTELNALKRKTGRCSLSKEQREILKTGELRGKPIHKVEVRVKETNDLIVSWNQSDSYRLLEHFDGYADPLGKVSLYSYEKAFMEVPT